MTLTDGGEQREPLNTRSLSVWMWRCKERERVEQTSGDDTHAWGWWRIINRGLVKQNKQSADADSSGEGARWGGWGGTALRQALLDDRK